MAVVPSKKSDTHPVSSHASRSQPSPFTHLVVLSLWKTRDEDDADRCNLVVLQPDGEAWEWLAASAKSRWPGVDSLTSSMACVLRESQALVLWFPARRLKSASGVLPNQHPCELAWPRRSRYNPAPSTTCTHSRPTRKLALPNRATTRALPSTHIQLSGRVLPAGPTTVVKRMLGVSADAAGNARIWMTAPGGGAVRRISAR